MDWQLLDGEGDTLPPERPTLPPTPRRRIRAVWLLVPLIVVAVVLGALWWQQDRQERQLRERFTEIVHNEARVLRSNDHEGSRALFEPGVPESWRYPYLQRAWFSAMGALLPSVGDVELTEGGERALVTVQYPRPEGPLYAGLEPIPEQRAYRLVEGAWRRTPMALDESEPIEVQSATFTLRGPRASVEALDVLALAELIRARLGESWPADRVERARLTIEIQPREFEGLTDFSQAIGYSPVSNATTPLIFNSLERFVATPTIPLAPETQYRLAAAEHILYRLTGRDAWPIMTGPGDRDQPQLFWHSALSLRRAQAEAWTLSALEHRAMIAWRRERLEGAWHDPLSGPVPPLGQPERGSYELSLDLLIDHMWLSYGDRALAEIASRVAGGAPEQSLADFFVAVTGEPMEALERAARRLALIPEP